MCLKHCRWCDDDNENPLLWWWYVNRVYLPPMIEIWLSCISSFWLIIFSIALSRFSRVHNHFNVSSYFQLHHLTISHQDLRYAAIFTLLTNNFCTICISIPENIFLRQQIMWDLHLKTISRELLLVMLTRYENQFTQDFNKFEVLVSLSNDLIFYWFWYCEYGFNWMKFFSCTLIGYRIIHKAFSHVSINWFKSQLINLNNIIN